MLTEIMTSESWALTFSIAVLVKLHARDMMDG